MSEFLLAALISSRICHDLTGPAGAVSNGVELLTEENDPAMREQSLELLSFTAAETSRRLQFYRLCFGAAGGANSQTGIGEARRAAEGFFEGRKQELIWPKNAIDELRVPHAIVQLMLNLVLLAGEALPRGGQIVVELSPRVESIKIQATGKNAGLREDDLAALAPGSKISSLDARTVQPWFAASVSREIGAQISLDQSQEGTLVFSAGPLLEVSA